MTFELLPLQQPHIDYFTRASVDVLSGFETTDDLELSANPTALRTQLKLYVIYRAKGDAAKTEAAGIRGKHLLSS
jgi:hypothetical protein